jgi:molecular chaperone GrpE
MTKKSAQSTADLTSDTSPDEENVKESADVITEEPLETGDDKVPDTEIPESSDESSELATEPEEETVEESEQDIILRLEKEIGEKNDKYLRLQAEFENFKRRNSQEMKSRIKFAGQPMALSFLSGLDNLERALDQAKAEESEAMKEFITGIEMVQQLFYDAFKQHHIERIYPMSEPFDPNKHEAMGVVETEEVEPDHIAQVFQAGYIYHDRVIRPAVVQVAKKK